VISRIVRRFYVQFLKNFALYVWGKEAPCIKIKKLHIFIYVSFLSLHHGFQCVHD